MKENEKCAGSGSTVARLDGRTLTEEKNRTQAALRVCEIFKEAANLTSKDAWDSTFRHFVEKYHHEWDTKSTLDAVALYFEILYTYRKQLCFIFMERLELQSTLFRGWIEGIAYAFRATGEDYTDAADEEEEDDSEVTCTICSATPAQH